MEKNRHCFSLLDFGTIKNDRILQQTHFRNVCCKIFYFVSGSDAKLKYKFWKLLNWNLRCFLSIIIIIFIILKKEIIKFCKFTSWSVFGTLSWTLELKSQYLIILTAHRNPKIKHFAVIELKSLEQKLLRTWYTFKKAFSQLVSIPDLVIPTCYVFDFDRQVMEASWRVEKQQRKTFILLPEK